MTCLRGMVALNVLYVKDSQIVSCNFYWILGLATCCCLNSLCGTLATSVFVRHNIQTSKPDITSYSDILVKGTSRGPEALQSHLNDSYHTNVLCLP